MSATPDPWRAREELYHAALDRPTAERAAFLEAACPDEELRHEVASLLQFAPDGDPLLHDSPFNAAAAPLPEEEFSPGTVLAERFRIVRRVGAGGMGTVYEAIDETLDRRVALKCAQAGHHLTLPPEARAAREVSHYNVCKVHDLHTVTTASGALTFLSMEFVEGETLAERIDRGGALKPGEALAIGRQLCAGLEQAHRQGVIHGDLKAGNVILAKAPDGGTRAVITDFGLARFAAPDGSRLASPRGGTPDYMAPELFRGERASVASDLYALGILFHEMLTTHIPRWTIAATPAGTPDATTVTGIGPTAAPDEKRRVEELPRPWKEIVKRCLHSDPARRFASAELVGEALEPRRTATKWVAAAALVVAAALGYWRWTVPPSGPPVHLAVLPFRIEGAPGTDVAAVAADIAERLSGARRNFTVITPLEAKQNQVDTPEKARTVLGATHVLQTRLTAAADHMAADAKLVDLESGKTLRTLNASYPAGDTAALAKALLGTVSVGLDLKSRTSGESVSDAAYPAYLRGLNTLGEDPRKADEAIPFLEQAVALDSRSALPYAALASAQVQKFRNGDGRQWLDRAAAAAAKASGINPDSVPVLVASGEIDQSRGRYDQAIFSLNRAAALDPANSRVWRMLAETYEMAGRDEDAVRTYRKAIDAEPGGYLPYLNFGRYYLMRGRYRESEEMSRKVTVLAPGLASGYMNLGLALKQQGRYQEAEQSLLKALSLRPSGRLLLNLGAVYYEQERYAEALRLFQEGAKHGAPEAALYRNLGDAYRHLSRAREAAAAYRAARALSEEEVTTNPRSAAARARLALLSARLGDTHRAAYELSQALSMESANVAVTADAIQALEVLHQRDRAIELLQNAPRSLGEELARVPDLLDLRRDPRFQQLFPKS